ncbi:MAG TPA: D-alanyl-D-alanine carboxypeptidase family protein [Mobilitalea sp.]|nr:D-alanyl-D-alanine carboxypeptidase family protein [Mobilitalea sp.]
MKRQKRLILCFILIYCFTTFSTVAYATELTASDSWPEGPGVYAEGAIVIEASSGLILYEKNMNQTYYPASITKIMTALLAIENSSPGEIVTFSNNAVFGVDADSSRTGIDVGEQLTMQQCLYAILLDSANEVSYAVAEHVGGGDAAVFSKMMNDRAKSIGCLNTNFSNPHGLPDDYHVSSAYDMALITQEALKNPSFRKIFSTRTYQIPPTNKQSEIRYIANHHKFVLKQDYFYDDCIGGKTGYTSKAKYTLVTAAKRGDLELICVVMKDDSSAHQYTDTQKLLDYGFNNFSIYPIADMESSSVLYESPFFTRYNSILSKSDASIKTDEKGFLVLPNNASFEDAVKAVSFFSTSDDKDGHDVIGNISYTYRGKYVGGADILFNNLETPTLFHKDLGPEEEVVVTAPEKVASVNSGGYLRPIIIGIIVGLFVLIIGLYFVLVERPRLKRRSAYYKKKANRRSYKDDNFMDL